jgi:putative nucleotidyltransferase with HDIG domain
VLPVVEGAFGYVTDVKLLELANLNHPALKELIVQAPGTYHHSILMGSLVEAAAQEIGANPLLARVCAYYHDLGKIRNPLYFAENQRGENRHETLAASMSALIVKRHVTDGLELARQWRLPRVVQDAIPQHHGTRLVSYFWAKAQRHAEEGGPRSGADEGVFRYPGPKPQSREVALVMIADACEASSRALEEPTEEALRALVSKRINEIFSEGQLDECELTLRDLNDIAGAMVSALEAIYHTRPAYPPRPGEGAPPPVQLVAKP